MISIGMRLTHFITFIRYNYTFIFNCSLITQFYVLVMLSRMSLKLLKAENRIGSYTRHELLSDCLTQNSLKPLTNKNPHAYALKFAKVENRIGSYTGHQQLSNWLTQNSLKSLTNKNPCVHALHVCYLFSELNTGNLTN